MTRGDQQLGGRVVWVAAGLAGIYVVIHLPMLYRSLVEWVRLVGALFGQ